MNGTMKLERAATAVALAALAVWVGGMVALGACAAPVVFSKVPAPLSGETMGTIFRRFDVVAMASAVVVLAAEAVRALLQPGRPGFLDRLRGIASLVAAGCAVYVGAVSSPAILALHESGAVRGVGEAGAALDRIHHLAEILGKSEVALGLLLIVLHVVTLRVASDFPAVAAEPLTEAD